MNGLLPLADFRVLRDRYQRERRQLALPVLREQWNALSVQIGGLKAHRGARVNVGLRGGHTRVGVQAAGRVGAGCRYRV